jgi:hypothetical protein
MLWLLFRPIVYSLTALHMASSYNVNQNIIVDSATSSRRSFCGGIAAAMIVLPAAAPCHGAITVPTTTTGTSPLAELEQARKQLQNVPSFIQTQEWDKVRSILITPPLSDLWTRTKRTNAFWDEYADYVARTNSAADDGADEFAVLELKDDLQSHLRYLDMAVYNNVFNPIKTFGETGATRELVRSYYDDPTREFQACASALDALVKMGSL